MGFLGGGFFVPYEMRHRVWLIGSSQSRAVRLSDWLIQCLTAYLCRGVDLMPCAHTCFRHYRVTRALRGPAGRRHT